MNQAFVGAGAAGFLVIVIIVVLVVYALNLTKTRGPPGEKTHIDKQIVSFENPMYSENPMHDAAEAQDDSYDSPAFINETEAPGYMDVEAEESDDTDLDDMDAEESEDSRDSE